MEVAHLVSTHLQIVVTQLRVDIHDDPYRQLPPSVPALLRLFAAARRAALSYVPGGSCLPFLEPFLATIRCEETSGLVTQRALSSVLAMLRAGAAVACSGPSLSSADAQLPRAPACRPASIAVHRNAPHRATVACAPSPRKATARTCLALSAMRCRRQQHIPLLSLLIPPPSTPQTCSPTTLRRRAAPCRTS